MARGFILTFYTAILGQESVLSGHHAPVRLGTVIIEKWAISFLKYEYLQDSALQKIRHFNFLIDVNQQYGQHRILLQGLDSKRERILLNERCTGYEMIDAYKNLTRKNKTRNDVWLQFPSHLRNSLHRYRPMC